MILSSTTETSRQIEVQTHVGIDECATIDLASGGDAISLSQDPRWLAVLARGLGHRPYCLEARQQGQCLGRLALARVSSPWFGRFLVSLPYLNLAGVQAANEAVALALVDRAVHLADELDVRYLELRQERTVDHPALAHRRGDKVNMRLALPNTVDDLWHGLHSKVRNQVRKAQSRALSVHWGQRDLLPDFYSVFSRNMRDLGTPVYGRALFESVLAQFPSQAEICSVRLEGRPIASALLLHGVGISEVPSASSLRPFNGTCANMLLYWHLLARSVERQQREFDFGRSSVDSATYRFKRQWGSHPVPSVWQYYLRRGGISDLRPENRRNRALIRVWRRLPLWLTCRLGPTIVRGIP